MRRASGVPDDEQHQHDLQDRARLAEADLIVGGEAARKARKQALYAAYVLALFGAVYGFPSE